MNPEGHPHPAKDRPRMFSPRRVAAVAVCLLLTALLLWVVFRDTDWRAVGNAMRAARPGWMLASVALVFLSFFTRAQRWSYIVRATSPVSFRRLFTSTQIGFLVNFISPARAGEFVRAFVLGRLTGIPFTKGLALVALDRVTDVIGVIAVLLVAIVAFYQMGTVYIPTELLAGRDPFQIPPAMVQTATALVTLGIAGMVAVLVLLYANQAFVLRGSAKLVSPISATLASHVHRLLLQFAEGLHVFRSPGDMAKSIGFSLLTWSCFVVSIATFQRAFGLEGPWYTPIVVQTLLALAIVIPIAPGFVGQFHFGIVAGLLLAAPEMPMAAAQAMAIVAHLINFVAVVLTGVVCLWMEHMGLFELRRISSEAQAEQEDAPKQ